MPNVTITNLTQGAIFLRDLYLTLGASSAVTVYRSASDLMASRGLQAAAEAGNVSVSITYTDTETSTGYTPYPGLFGWATEVNSLTKEPSGFVNRTDSTISKVDGTRTLTITPVGSYVVYFAGNKKTITAPKSVQWADTEGLKYFYLDPNEILQVSETFSASILRDNCFVSVLYWDATNNVSHYFAEERHGITMDNATHIHLHLSIGAQYYSGLDPSLLATIDGNGSLDTQAQVSITDGTIADEDLIFSMSETSQVLSPVAVIPVFYRTGSGAGEWRVKTADSFPLIYSGTAGYTGAAGRAAYNFFSGGSWSLAEANQNDYFLTHIYATNNIPGNNPVVAICGQALYSTLAAARNGATREIYKIEGLPFAEFVPLCTLIWQTNGTWANTPKAALRSTEFGESFVDFRKARLV